MREISDRIDGADLVVDPAPSARRRRRLIRTIALASVLIVAAAVIAIRWVAPSEPPAPPIPISLSHRLLVDHYEPWGYVAHALGSVEGTVYTNSIEAFELSYRKGFRLFEIDLNLLRDGEILAAHDAPRYGITDRNLSDLTAEDVKSLRFRGLPGTRRPRLTKPLITAEGLVRLMKQYPDAHFITDTKGPHGVEILARLKRIAPPSVMGRFIPHVVSEGHLEGLRQVYPFRTYILALYRLQNANAFDDQQVLDVVRRNHVPAVMMWWRPRDPSISLKLNSAQHRRFRPELVRELQSMGVAVYVHSLDNPRDMAPFRDLHVGVYSNGWYPGG